MGDWLFLILIAVWFQTATAFNEINFEKARVFQTQKLFQFASKTEEEKNSFMFSYIITSYSHHILFTYIEVLHPAELRTLCHSSLSNFPSPFLSALANILATCKVKVKLKTVVKVLHESKSLLLQTSRLPAMLKRFWKWIRVTYNWKFTFLSALANILATSNVRAILKIETEVYTWKWKSTFSFANILAPCKVKVVSKMDVRYLATCNMKVTLKLDVKVMLEIKRAC